MNPSLTQTLLKTRLGKNITFWRKRAKDPEIHSWFCYEYHLTDSLSGKGWPVYYAEARTLTERQMYAMLCYLHLLSEFKEKYGIVPKELTWEYEAPEDRVDRTSEFFTVPESDSSNGPKVILKYDSPAKLRGYNEPEGGTLVFRVFCFLVTIGAIVGIILAFI